MFFIGEYRVTFSGQGRIIIPKKIREALGTGKAFTLTKGFDSCLSGFRNTDWEKAAKELISQSSLEVQKSETKRHLFSSAAIVEIDNQGRFVIPRTLMEYAGLNNKAAIIGVGDHFEVWDPKKWDEYIKKIKP
ncbi:division/cell wall cluster transcriptional repressor MraZ [Candidatus Roizmanbacteria bacterium RIFCSPHIGHO2_12_FULL_37_9b]|uniref:Transcriptional regulator MraZ n=1 Tax=Candidatus Roizmanbacteria bacterium RIFCSPHIGHO2_02_FULL_38_11 TaxID=1802039 RepID=A0A1F7H0B5_9BACT|nr:MAG: division/cell wall cluster transcriptional repressor MraZ [Candidatus Roizmanbacteria bacterium RIFCSPHIGHO2_02_FULL_38_11]OGK35217.1 MAG: division/cell wall cluster transcriptional repressor MraZ [Candidatus Roizmanbacteria bacterium RIFCSPHIGHO2_12_FULL_37_9b]